jgi:predicted nucleic acid-binding protein
LAEAHGWFLKRYDRNRALQFLSFIEELKVLKILSVGPQETKESAQILRYFSDQDLTLTDACGLYLMKKHQIKSCWSVDYHLGLTGVPLVIHA